MPPRAGHRATSTALHRVLTLPRQPQGTHYAMSRLANQIPSSLLRALLQVRPPKPTLLQTSAISQRRVRLDSLPNKTPNSQLWVHQIVQPLSCAPTSLYGKRPTPNGKKSTRATRCRAPWPDLIRPPSPVPCWACGSWTSPRSPHGW